MILLPFLGALAILTVVLAPDAARVMYWPLCAKSQEISSSVNVMSLSTATVSASRSTSVAAASSTLYSAYGGASGASPCSATADDAAACGRPPPSTDADAAFEDPDSSDSDPSSFDFGSSSHSSSVVVPLFCCGCS